MGQALHGDLAPLADWLMVFLPGEGRKKEGGEHKEGRRGRERERVTLIIFHFISIII